jgi:hypothetical protein
MLANNAVQLERFEDTAITFRIAEATMLPSGIGSPPVGGPTAIALRGVAFRVTLPLGGLTEIPRSYRSTL